MRHEPSVTISCMYYHEEQRISISLGVRISLQLQLQSHMHLFYYTTLVRCNDAVSDKTQVV